MCRTIFLHAILYGCGTWSLALRREERESVLRRILKSKGKQVTGEWIKLHNKELHDLYFWGTSRPAKWLLLSQGLIFVVS